MMAKLRLTKVQQELLDEMRQGRILWSLRDRPYELAGREFWPRQKRTVEKLIDAGLIVFDGRENETQRECGMATLGLKKER